MLGCHFIGTASFCLKKTSPPCSITVIDSNTFIEIYANVSTEATALQCAHLLPIIKGSIFGGIAAACRALKYKETYPEIGFICPHYEASSSGAPAEKTKLHSASVSHHNDFWCCDEDTSISGLLHSRHHVWFGTGICISSVHASSTVSLVVHFTVIEDSITPASPHAPSQAPSPKGGSHFQLWLSTL